MKVRAFRADDRDFAAHMRLVNLQYPDEPTSTARLRHVHAAKSQEWWRHLIVELIDQVVAYGEIGQVFWTRCPVQYFVQVDVDPTCLGQGIGSCVFTRLLEMAQADNQVTMLTAECRDDKRMAVKFLTNKGFNLDCRSPASELEIATFNEQPFVPRIKQAVKNGIRFSSLQDFSQLPDWPERYWRLNEELQMDVPSPEPYRKRTLSQFVHHKIEAPEFAPDCTHIALGNSKWVGQSVLLIDPEHPEIGGTGLTGVREGWRRMGIATALKLVGLRAAREREVKRVVTNNEENNPMLDINQRLGFKPLPAWLGWSLILDSKSLKVQTAKIPVEPVSQTGWEIGTQVCSLVCILGFPSRKIRPITSHVP